MLGDSKLHDRLVQSIPVLTHLTATLDVAVHLCIPPSLDCSAYARWLVHHCARTPLEVDEYVIEAFTTANDLFEQADAQFTDAQKTDDRGDNFDLAAVFLAVSLFFAGIAALFMARKIQVAMLIGSALADPARPAVDRQGQGLALRVHGAVRRAEPP